MSGQPPYPPAARLARTNAAQPKLLREGQGLSSYRDVALTGGITRTARLARVLAVTAITRNLA